jgi:hypothetical protein
MKLLTIAALISFGIAQAQSMKTVFVTGNPSEITVLGYFPNTGLIFGPPPFEYVKKGLKKCKVVAVAPAASGADYIVNIVKGRANLEDADGHLIYASPQRNEFRMAKDICDFVASHP